MCPQLKAFTVLLFALWMLFPLCTAVADSKETAAPTTTADPKIPVDELDIIAAPMTVDELKVEADHWLALVKQAAENVAQAKLRIKRQNQQRKEADARAEAAEETIEAGSGGQPEAEKAQAVAEAEAQRADEKKDLALDELTAFRAERTALIDRLDVILARINQKIGLEENGKEKPEVLVYRRYIDAVGGIKLDVSDAETAASSIMGWAMSKEGGLRWAINIATFLAILIAFWLLSRILRRATHKALAVTGNESRLLTDFIVGMVGRVVMFVGLLVGLAALEVNIGPLLAVIGAAGFVVAFALQNTLGNFASGIMIMLYRPFDVDDVVEVAGIIGKVRSLNLVSTTITTPDNKRMVVPNNEIWGNIITNATGTDERRVDMVFGIGYEDDIGKAKQVLESIVADHSLVLSDPKPVIQLHELADSSVNFICRPWVKTGDYWTVYWDVTRSVKDRFDAEGISIPFPQRDVHVYHEQKSLAKPDSHKDSGSTSSGSEQMGLDGD